MDLRDLIKFIENCLSYFKRHIYILELTKKPPEKNSVKYYSFLIDRILEVEPNLLPEHVELLEKLKQTCNDLTLIDLKTSFLNVKIL